MLKKPPGQNDSTDTKKPSSAWWTFGPILFIFLVPTILILASAGLGWFDLLSKDVGEFMFMVIVSLYMFRRIVTPFWIWRTRRGQEIVTWSADTPWLLAIFVVVAAWTFAPYIGWRRGWISKDDAFLIGVLSFAVVMLLSILLPRIVEKRDKKKQQNASAQRRT